MYFIRQFLLISMIGTLLLVPQMFAEPITFSFTGSVSWAHEYTQGTLPPGIFLGTPFTGSITFDGASIDSQPSDPSLGEYTSIGMPYGAQITIGPNSFAWTSSTIDIHYNYVWMGGNLVDDGFYYYPYWTGPQSSYFYLTLMDTTHTAFSSDALLLTPPLLSEFDLTQIQISGPSIGMMQSQYIIDGQLDSLASPVPEPTSLLLLGTGLGVIGLAAWRRRK